ncbi:hypothetical protein Mapa_006983 [Marchantia paleacea]|nr:hypothetical protein Mapa_006983 [Marchantia paleacea]
MENSMKFTMVLALVHLSFLLLFSTTALSQTSHIVYMGQTHSHLQNHEITAIHNSMLGSTLGNADMVQGAMIYSYTNAFSGFAAKLSPEHISKISSMDGVLSVFPNSAKTVQTTQSWKFLGLETYDMKGTNAFGQKSASNLWTQAKFGEDVIIGMVDTGIWPESQSFKDDGYSDIPKKWKGSCVEGDQFTKSNCNKKLIGAKFFNKAFEAENGKMDPKVNIISARDQGGHGTHTASTAGGSVVPNVSANGFGNGTAKGGAPKARIAVYKVCWSQSKNSTDDPCYLADIMAAMDEALADGVDLMSISLGGGPITGSLAQDGMGILAFHAMQKGVLVVFAGGNSGPAAQTIDHSDPWSLTVGASSMDRNFVANVQLGELYNLEGATTTDYETITAPLVLSEQSAHINVTAAQLCLPDSLDPAKVLGKIVFCLRGQNARAEKGMVVNQAGGVGMILGNAEAQGEDISADDHVLPAIAISATSAKLVTEYVHNFSKPAATLFKGKTILGVKPSPVVVAFSSVGPSIVTPDILKPDVIAPGLNVLAAWSEASSPTSIAGDDRVVSYNCISGTSMATPHIAGVVALLKAVHPDWSSSAIKSAIMTTATGVDNSNHRIGNSASDEATPFEAGSGMMHPAAAANPGLVYVAGVLDYTTFLCSLKYNNTQVQIITGVKNACTDIGKKLKRFPSPSDLNLPSLTVADLEAPRTIRREVTNVDKTGSVYKLQIVPPKGISVTVFPSTLTFKYAGEKKRFYVTLKMEETHNMEPGSYTFGSLTWTNGKRKVRSPLVVGYNGKGSR